MLKSHGAFSWRRSRYTDFLLLPYARVFNWSPLPQPFLSQRKYDKRVADLGTAMQDALTFVDEHGQLEAESLARSPKHKGRLQSLLAVLTDCAGWVMEYGRPSFGTIRLQFASYSPDLDDADCPQ